MCCKHYIVCLVFAIVTVLQTAAHLYFVVSWYFFHICSAAPSSPSSIFFYLTYLYKKECGKIIMTSVLPPPILSMDAFFSKIHEAGGATTYYNFSQIVEEIVQRAELPDTSTAAGRTFLYILCYIIVDGVWIVAAVALLMGTSFNIKEAISLVFYGPWLIATVLVLMLDIVASVHFGFDLIETTTFTNWMRFVGIQNIDDFADLDGKSPSAFLPMSPTIVVISLTSRCIILWIVNLIGLIYVFKAAYFAFKQNYRSESSRSLKEDDGTQELDTSAERIRNWQLFYGALDTTTSNDSRDFNSNANVSQDKAVKIRVPHNSLESQKSGNSTAEVIPSLSTCYMKYPDVAEEIGRPGTSRTLEELRGQLPWSYVERNDNLRKKSLGMSPPSDLKLYGVIKNDTLTSKVSETSGTYL